MTRRPIYRRQEAIGIGSVPNGHGICTSTSTSEGIRPETSCMALASFFPLSFLLSPLFFSSFCEGNWCQSVFIFSIPIYTS